MSKSRKQMAETNLMMMNPPSAGDDLSIPRSAVTHRHGAGFSQGSRGDGVTCSTTAEAPVSQRPSRFYSKDCKGQREQSDNLTGF